MNRIRLLQEQVANQIAAGEVVERPASVVKELVENALDAHPTRIVVEIQAGGRSLIRVTDDGIGMGPDDALLSLERHATSKIYRAEDLASISTMGFRGEALPSIASVSRFSLTTREQEGDGTEGTQIVVHGGRILEVKSAGHAPGTSVEVRQLFYNLPARRKFLRSEETERAHILHYLTLAALAFPEIGFTVLQDGNTVWQLPPLKTDHQAASALAAVHGRLRALLGSELKLLSLDFTTDIAEPEAVDGDSDALPGAVSASPFRTWGFIGAPGVSRATRQDAHLFVNRRPVENRSLNYALMEGYHTALMKGRYPVCCLFLEIDPAEVDVNIHPAKREVKFNRERAVRRKVSEAVRQTLLNFHRESAAPDFKYPSGNARVGRTTESEAEPSSAVRTGAVLQTMVVGLSSPRLSVGERSHLLPTPSGIPGAPRTASGSEIIAAGSVPPAHPSIAAHGRQTAAALPPAAVPLLAVPLRLAGVIGRLYVLLESDRGLVLMDQHAAHERVLFEQMLRRLEQGNAPSQRLLLAQTVELSPRDAAFVREQLGVLGRLGVGLSEFGEQTFLLDALPPFVTAPDARRFVLELIDELVAAGQQVNSLRLGEQVVAKTVCRHAVKANDPLNDAELESLISDLRRCEMPYTCPHGRPTLIEMSYRELEKKFGRLS